MAREQSPGLKDPVGLDHRHRAILVTNVVRTRLRDLEQAMNHEQQLEEQSTLSNSVLVDTSPKSDEGVIKEVRT